MTTDMHLIYCAGYTVKQSCVIEYFPIRVGTVLTSRNAALAYVLMSSSAQLPVDDGESFMSTSKMLQSHQFSMQNSGTSIVSLST